MNSVALSHILASTTTISALKLYEMKSLYDSPDPTYTSVNLSIYAIAEVFVGAFTASLPPMRKTFENLLHKVLPASLTGASRSTGNSYALKGVGSQPSTKSSSSRPKHDCDDDSELGILPEDTIIPGKELDNTIVRTTHVAVSADDKSEISRRRQDDWV